MAQNTAYVVKLDNAADYNPGGPLAGFYLSPPTQGTKTEIDSDGTLVGGFDQANVTTPDSGADHSIDFGFVPPVTIGDYVFKDNNDNGIQDGGDTAIAGVTVHLYNPAGTLIATAVTDVNGKYTFSSATGTSTCSAIFNLGAALPSNTAGFTIKLDNASRLQRRPARRA